MMKTVGLFAASFVFSFAALASDKGVIEGCDHFEVIMGDLEGVKYKTIGTFISPDNVQYDLILVNGELYELQFYGEEFCIYKKK